MKDIYIVILLTVADGWRWSLPLVGFLCGGFFWHHRPVMGCLCVLLLLWLARAAWEIETWL